MIALTPEQQAKLDQQEFNQILENRRWTHRRKMAYTALYSGIGIMVALAVMFFVSLFTGYSDISLIGELGAVFSTGLLALFGLVGAYMGFSTYEPKNTPDNPDGTH